MTNINLHRPPRVYFDTANLARVADEADGGSLWPLFRELIQSCAIVPVFSYCQVTERAAASEATLARMDARITPLLRAGYGVCVRDYNAIQRIELENELSRQGFGPPSGMTPVVASFAGLGGPRLPDSFAPFPGFTLIAQLDAQRARPPFRTLGPSFVAYQKNQRALRGHRHLSESEVLAALSPYLPRDVKSFPQGFVFERARMPFIDLMFGYFDGSLLSDGGDDDSDLLDVLHLTGVAYADHGFVDSRTYDRLRRGGVLRPAIQRNAELGQVMTTLAEQAGISRAHSERQSSINNS